MSNVVRLVDAWIDNDPKTRDSCPGKINGHELHPIGIQWNRRFRFFKKIKHIIYQEVSTRNIWYKNSKCNAGVVAMGFSLSRLANHPNTVSMEIYSMAFLDNPNDLIIELGITGAEWLARNDYELI